MPLATPQLCLLRCLDKRPFPAELLDIFLARCGASQGQWNELAGAVATRNGYLELTQAGRKLYRTEKKGRYF